MSNNPFLKTNAEATCSIDNSGRDFSEMLKASLILINAEPLWQFYFQVYYCKVKVLDKIAEFLNAYFSTLEGLESDFDSEIIRRVYFARKDFLLGFYDGILSILDECAQDYKHSCEITHSECDFIYMQVFANTAESLRSSI